MEIVVSYLYALGDAENIRDCNLDGMRTSANLEGLEVDPSFDDGELRVPAFVGVYQIVWVKHSGFESEKDENKFYLEAHKVNNHLREALSRLHVNDVLDADLVCVGYQDNVCPRSITKTAITDSARRVRFYPVSQMPDFTDKDVSSFYGVVKAAVDMNQEFHIEEVARAVNFDFSRCMRGVRRFGLTRLEYAFSRGITDPRARELGLISALEPLFS